MKIIDFFNSVFSEKIQIDGGFRSFIDDAIAELDIQINGIELYFFCIYKFLHESCLGQQGKVVFYDGSNSFFIKRWASSLNIESFNVDDDKSLFVLFVNYGNESEFRNYFFSAMKHLKNKKIVILSSSNMQMFEDWKEVDHEKYSNEDVTAYFLDSNMLIQRIAA